MKIITWNVNSVRSVEKKGELQSLDKKEKPDILLLQETRGNIEQFSSYLANNPEYDQYYHSAEKKGYAGTGIWIKKEFVMMCKNVKFNTEVPHLPNSDEGRVSHVSFFFEGNNYDVLSIYFPNGGKSKKAWNDKLVFFDKILDYMNKLRDDKHIVIVGGDMNVAHTEIDLSNPKANDGKIGFHPDERAWFSRVIENGWCDVWRSLNTNVTEVYSWWSSITKARNRNVGWRLDYFFLDKKLLENTMNVKYLNQQFGSDHCPLRMEIKI